MATISAAAGTSDETTAEFDSEQLAQGWESLAKRSPAKHCTVLWAARTDIGRVRENNEDKFDFFLPDDPPMLAVRGRLWAVADGMGGHSAGQIASEAALKAVIRSYFALSGGNEVEAAVRMALHDANALLFRAARQFVGQGNMGTTAVVAVLQEDNLIVAHIGDSRAYLLRDGQLRQLTVDHSWVEEQVRRGGLTREQAEASPHRNIITRSVGMMETVECDITTEVVRENDTILLCSDGLTGLLSDTEIAERLKNNPSQAALDLIDGANDAGGRDNITALILRVRGIEPFDGTDRLRSD